MRPAEQDDTSTTRVRAGQREIAEVIASVPGVDEIVLPPADEVDHAKALKSDIDYYERLHRLYSDAIDRRNDTLRQFDFYRHGLGQQLRRVSDEIIDAEFSETKHEAPSLAGPDGDAE